MHGMRIGNILPPKRLANKNDSLTQESKKDFSLKTGDLVRYGNRTFEIFAVSPSGLLTLKNIVRGASPASIIITSNQAKGIIPLIRTIKS